MAGQVIVGFSVSLTVTLNVQVLMLPWLSVAVLVTMVVPIVKADCERQVREAGRCVLMVDGLDVKMHTTEFREEMTAWFRDNETAVVHMLVRSPMVQMALNVANLVMGSSRAMTYLSVSEWEAAGRREIASFARRPLVVPADLVPERG